MYVCTYDYYIVHMAPFHWMHCVLASTAGYGLAATGYKYGT